jgi:hypothetical protein
MSYIRRLRQEMRKVRDPGQAAGDAIDPARLVHNEQRKRSSPPA